LLLDEAENIIGAAEQARKEPNGPEQRVRRIDIG